MRTGEVTDIGQKCEIFLMRLSVRHHLLIIHSKLI